MFRNQLTTINSSLKNEVLRNLLTDSQRHDIIREELLKDGMPEDFEYLMRQHGIISTY